jgi:hypothetical protein
MLLPTVQFREGIVMVGTVAGEDAGEFLLDSGASVCVVSPAFADRFGRDTATIEQWIIAADGERMRASRQVVIEGLRFGDYVLRPLNAVVVDLSPLPGNFAGIIGIDALSGRVTIDYELEQVRMGGPIPHGAERLAQRDPALPIVQALVEGRSINVLLDTGSSGAWTLATDDLEVLPGPASNVGVRLIDGARWRSSRHMRGEATLGPVRFAQPVVHDSPYLPRVGERVLRELRVLTFDPARRSVWIHDTTDRVVHLAPVRGMGAVLYAADGVWVVRSVAPGLPASALGLEPGDIVHRVDGFAPDEISPRTLAERMAAASVVMLEMDRDGQRVTLPVPVVYIQP